MGERWRLTLVVIVALLDLNLFHLVDLLVAGHLLGWLVRVLGPEGWVLLAESLRLLGVLPALLLILLAARLTLTLVTTVLLSTALTLLLTTALLMLLAATLLLVAHRMTLLATELPLLALLALLLAVLLALLLVTLLTALLVGRHELARFVARELLGDLPVFLAELLGMAAVLRSLISTSALLTS
ncbi:hypothetical protein [Halomicrobium urmianum]|uniref:hypothetical protein n=1 Tax=Halomicrobium urmianum TaxID=1586233 RepID=UPI001CD9313B|nr:hypothetical protein [Halomicrobium urmianum]